MSTPEDIEEDARDAARDAARYGLGPYGTPRRCRCRGAQGHGPDCAALDDPPRRYAPLYPARRTGAALDTLAPLVGAGIVPDWLAAPFEQAGIHSGYHLAAILAGAYALVAMGEWLWRAVRAELRDAPPRYTPPPNDKEKRR